MKKMVVSLSILAMVISLMPSHDANAGNIPSLFLLLDNPSPPVNLSPTSYWYLDETGGNGTIFTDYGSYGVDAQSITGNSTVAGVINAGRQYTDMWNSNIRLRDNSNYRFDRFDAFSIELWTKWPVGYTPMTSHELFVGALEYLNLQIGGETNLIIRRAGLMNWGKKYALHFFYQNDTIPSTVQMGARTTNEYDDGLWHHVIVTYDGSNNSNGIKFYVDGVQVAKEGVSSASLTRDMGWTDDCEISIGYSLSNNFAFDEVVIYDNKVLNESEVAFRYNNGTPHRNFSN
jgi:hypothetical protein